MDVTWTSPNYAVERVTGRYVRRLSKRDGGGYKVCETATGTGRFAGKPGHGPTLREWVTMGAEIPETVRAEADTTHTTVKWD